MGFLKHYVWPILAIVSGPIILQWLVQVPRDDSTIGMYPNDREVEGFKRQMIFGNTFSWIVSIVWISWNAFFLVIPFDHYIGRSTLFGYSPKYVHNGPQLYVTNFLAFLMVQTFFPNINHEIYTELPYILGTFNIIGLALTFALWLGGDSQRFRLTEEEKLPPVSYFYELYRGMQLHPMLYDVDLKQFVIRMGYNTWQMLILSHVLFAYMQHGFDAGHFAFVFVQCIYMLYFFNWERGHLLALDMTYGRAGFFLIWGSLNWVPFFNSFATYYMVSHPTKLSYWEAALAVVVCCYLIHRKFQVDNQKLGFQESDGVNFRIDGKEAQFLDVKYESKDGTKSGKLLVSGYWGLARHYNYTWELICALSWSLMTFKVGSVFTFLYPILLAVVLVQRTFRDEEKCKNKYGEYWQKYCNVVKYRLIPHLF